MKQYLTSDPIILLVLYIGTSLFFLTRYPSVYGDEMFYSEPPINFLEHGDFRSNIYAPKGGFNKSNLVHGRIFNFVQVGIFKVLGVSVFTMRLQAFLSGMGVLWLTSLIAYIVLKSRWIAFFSTCLLALSHPFIFSSHFSRPDMMVTLFIMGSIHLFLKQRYFWCGLVSALAMDVHISGLVAVCIIAGMALHKCLK